MRQAESRQACDAARIHTEAIAAELATALQTLTGAYEELERQLAETQAATHKVHMEANAAAIVAHTEHVREAAATARGDSAAREKAEKQLEEVLRLRLCSASLNHA